MPEDKWELEQQDQQEGPEDQQPVGQEEDQPPQEEAPKPQQESGPPPVNQEDLRKTLEEMQRFVQQAQQAQQAPAKKNLLTMDKDEFAQYLRTKGIDGLYELRNEMQQLVQDMVRHTTAAAFVKMSEEAKARVLQASLNDWAEDNKDLMQDPVAKELVRAVDRATFQRYGVSDIGQLGPKKVRQHLDEVAATVRKMMQAMKGGSGMQQQVQQPKTGVEMPPTLARLPGEGTPPGKRLEELSGFELEMAMANMSKEEIERLFEED